MFCSLLNQLLESGKFDVLNLQASRTEKILDRYKPDSKEAANNKNIV